MDKQKYTMMESGGFTVTINENQIDTKYLLGLLNSKLLSWFLNRISNVFRSGWITCTKQYFGQLPIIINDLSNAQLTMQDEIIYNVNSLLQLNKEKQSATLQTQIDQIQSRIDYYEDKINLAVYQLYSLTEDEIKIIDKSTTK